MTIIGNYIRQNGAGLPYGDFSKRCRTTYIFIFDHSPRRTPPTPLSTKSVISKRFMVWEVTFSNSLRTKLWGYGSFWVAIKHSDRARVVCLTLMYKYHLGELNILSSVLTSYLLCVLKFHSALVPLPTLNQTESLNEKMSVVHNCWGPLSNNMLFKRVTRLLPPLFY